MGCVENKAKRSRHSPARISPSGLPFHSGVPKTGPAPFATNKLTGRFCQIASAFAGTALFEMKRLPLADRIADSAFAGESQAKLVGESDAEARATTARGKPGVQAM